MEIPASVSLADMDFTAFRAQKHYLMKANLLDESVIPQVLSGCSRRHFITESHAAKKADR